MALVESLAAAKIGRLDDSIDHMLSRDADGYTNEEEVQKNIEDVERCIEALDTQVESKTVMSRRFFSERKRECPYTNRISRTSWLM